MFIDIVRHLDSTLSNHSLYSQEEVIDKMVYVKLFDAYGSANWYITEYDITTKIAFGYVEYLMPDPICDEWWYISLDELKALKIWPIPRIEPDLFFKPKRFSQIGVRR